MKTPEQVVAEAIKLGPVAIRVGFSGGRDSLAITHWMMNNVPGGTASPAQTATR